jgi:UDP-2,3-diacylglucosamine pyrophosphatase LpxH
MSVSLDKTKAPWLAAIEKDNLSWPNHVSDLNGWNSRVPKFYGVRGIPFTVLIDREGNIITSGNATRGEALAENLARIFWPLMSNETKNIYFASDFHLGAPNHESSLIREKSIVSWLDHIKDDAAEIYLVGDLFDFWFEYKRAIPKGFVRLQGKIAELTDKGIPVHIFTGNHDMWIFDYLPKELGVSLFRKPIEREFFGKRYLIGHGDGLGPGDRGYKFLKKVFANKFCQWCFARLHPNFGIWLADKSSKTSRAKLELQMKAIMETTRSGFICTVKKH